MSAKRYVQGVLTFSFAFLVLCVIGAAVIDPYNVFHVNNIRDNGVEPNKNYIKMSFLLEHPDRFNTFMFGSSKLEAIHTDKMRGEKCYNMTCSRGLPVEHFANIKTLLANGVHIKKVYMGIDSYSYTDSPQYHLNEHLVCPYEPLKDDLLHFCSMYLSPSMVMRSIPIILASKPHDYDYRGRFYNYGDAVFGTGRLKDWSNAEPFLRKWNLIDETLEDMRDIVTFCREENIELIIFVNPMHPITYRASLERNYLHFVEELAQITEFYNFGGLNNIVLDNDYFRDTGHYTEALGDMMIDVMINGKQYSGLYEQGFGWKVTKDNVQEFLTLPEISGSKI